MDDLQQILQKYKEFGEYLQSIDLANLKKNYSRQELKEFTKELYSVKHRSVAYEVNQMIDEMKKEEYPELLGVHHYPVIRKIDFLSEDKKKELDEFLVRFRKGNYLSGFWRIVRDQKVEKQIESFLIENGVLEPKYAIYCPHCADHILTSYMNKEEKEELDKLVNQPFSWDKFEELEEKMEGFCMECEEEINLEKMEKFHWKEVLQMVVERDKSLDHV